MGTTWERNRGWPSRTWAFKFKMATDIRREDSPGARGGGRDLTLCVLTEKAAVQEQQINVTLSRSRGRSEVHSLSPGDLRTGEGSGQGSGVGAGGGGLRR